MSCTWCKGVGVLSLAKYGKVSCLNCHGTGKGKDGGDRPISYARKPWAINNLYAKKVMNELTGGITE